MAQKHPHVRTARIQQFAPDVTNYLPHATGTREKTAEFLPRTADQAAAPGLVTSERPTHPFVAHFTAVLTTRKKAPSYMLKFTDSWAHVHDKADLRQSGI